MSKQVDPIIFDFLNQLAANNNKPWFDAHRAFYEQARGAFLSFAQFFNQQVGTLDPALGEQDIKKCIYRINRDVRFSPDKSPYKRHLCVFIAPNGKNSLLPGYYFHVQPNGATVFGVGVYCLDPEGLKRLRTEVTNFPEDIHSIVTDPAFLSHVSLSEHDKLKTLPRGFTCDPQYQYLLKYKAFSSEAHFTDEQVLSPDFANRLVACIRASVPLCAFLRRALLTEPEPDIDF